MTKYIAFLRAINVGGHNRMKMADLRALFETLGFAAVETYIQSGNVIFESPEPEESALRATIQDAIADEFGYDITVMLRTQNQLAGVVSGQPFDVDNANGIRHYVCFLNDEPTDEGIQALLAAQTEAERFVVRGRAVYSELDKDTLGDGRSTDVGTQLGMESTRRTWDVVTAVLEQSA